METNETVEGRDRPELVLSEDRREGDLGWRPEPEQSEDGKRMGCSGWNTKPN